MHDSHNAMCVNPIVTLQALDGVERESGESAAFKDFEKWVNLVPPGPDSFSRCVRSTANRRARSRRQQCQSGSRRNRFEDRPARRALAVVEPSARFRAGKARGYVSSFTFARISFRHVHRNECLVQRLMQSSRGTGDGPRASNMAIGKERTAVAVAPDRNHGTDRSSRSARPSGGPAGAGKGPRPIGPAGVLSICSHRLAPLICDCAGRIAEQSACFSHR